MNGATYYVRLGTQLLGPLNIEQLKRLKDRGRLQPFHSISSDGRTWQPASSLTQLFPPESQATLQHQIGGQAGGPATPGTAADGASPPADAWYYMDSQGNQAGPVPQARLLELLITKEISLSTYVWTAGLSEWKKLEEALPGLAKAGGRTGGRLLDLDVGKGAWISAAAVGILVLIIGIYFLVGHFTGSREPQFFYRDEAGAKLGPVTEMKLRELRDCGDVADDTPVTNVREENWRPLMHLIRYSETLDAGTLFERVFRGVPMLLSRRPRSDGRGFGSGFVISTQKRKGIRWFVVTNRHVVEGAQETLGEPMPNLPFQPKWQVLFFERADGRTITLAPQDGIEVYAIHPKADLAIIECTRIKNWLKHRQVYVFRLGPRDLELKPGTEVIAIGHPGKVVVIDHPGNPGAEIVPEPMTYTKGQIAGPEREFEGCRFYQLQVPLAPGNSGGPVLDMTGQVVGIVTLGAALLNQGQFNYALHIKYLHELLDDIP